MATPFLNHWYVAPTRLAVRKLILEPVQILTVPFGRISAAFASGMITGTTGYLLATTVMMFDETAQEKELVTMTP